MGENPVAKARVRRSRAERRSASRERTAVAEVARLRRQVAELRESVARLTEDGHRQQALLEAVCVIAARGFELKDLPVPPVILDPPQRARDEAMACIRPEWPPPEDLLSRRRGMRLVKSDAR
jgi:hypothetical protein